MKLKIKLIFIIILSIVLSQCKKKEIDIQRVALKVGEAEITDYEIFHYYTPFELSYKQRFGKTPPKDSIEGFKNWLRDRTYYLADAYDKDYDTLTSIKEKANRMFSYEVVKRDGILWNAQEKDKLNVSEKEEQETLKLMGKLIYFDICNINLLPKEFRSTFIADTILNTSKEFNDFIKRYKDKSFFSVESRSFQWPFAPFEQQREKLLTAHQGQVLGPIYTDFGIYYLNITKIEQLDPQSLVSYKTNINSIAKSLKENDIIYKKQKEIDQAIKSKVRTFALEKIFEKLSNPMSINIPDKDWGTDTLMTYTLNNQYKVVNASEFINYIRNYPEKISNLNKSSLRYLLEFKAHEEYLVLEAKSKGLLNTPESEATKKAIFHSMLYNHYYQKEFFNSKITDTELEKYYKSVRYKYTDGESCKIDQFDFNNEKDAFKYAQKIKAEIAGKRMDTIFNFNYFTGLTKLKRGIEIKYTDTTSYQKSIFKNIFEAPEMTVLGPIEFVKGQFTLLLKESEIGERTLSLNEVKDILIQQLKTSKMNARIKEQKDLLLKKYKIEDNIEL